MNRSLLPTFLTSCDAGLASESSPIQVSERETKLKSKIISLIDGMPPKQVCLQAIGNLGLRQELLNFSKIKKQVAGQKNIKNLQFTMFQLNTLFKETRKLKMTDPREKSFEKKQISVGKYADISPLNSTSAQNLSSPTSALRIAIQEELQYRQKRQKFYAESSKARRNAQLKKKIERAKLMNKKAGKVYASFKEKQKRAFQFFKIQTLYEPPKTAPATAKNPQPIQEQIQPPIQPSLAKVSSSMSYSPQRSDEQRIQLSPKNKIQIRIPRNSNKKQIAPKTAVDNKKADQNRKRRQMIQRQKENMILLKNIKKQHKIARLHDKISETIQKQENQEGIINNIVIKRRSPLQNRSIRNEGDELKILEQCEKGISRKQRFLHERVEKVRQDLRNKEERRDKYKFTKDKLLRQSNSEFYSKLSGSFYRSLESCYPSENVDSIQFRIKQRRQKAQIRLEATSQTQKVKHMTTSELKRNLRLIKCQDPSKTMH